jgi:PKHD-type hydroxylase
MIRQFENFLTGPQLQRLNAVLEKAAFADGAATAGVAARGVKNNLQANAAQPEMDEAREIFAKAVMQNKEFRDIALPLHIMPPLFSRYETGMRYGDHTDNAMMGGTRTDLAMTLFLNPPEAYDGGELVIDADREPRSIKLAAGAAVLYPASSLHRVETVTRGRRQVAVTWIQSMLRDAGQREIIIDLSLAINRLRAIQHDSQDALLIAKTRANLLRMWSDT